MSTVRRALSAAALSGLVFLPARSHADAPPSTRASATESAGEGAKDAPRLDGANYTLRAKLDPVAHSVHGEGEIVLRNASSATLTEVWLHLYLNAFKNQRSVFMRDPVGGFRGSTKPLAWGTIDLRTLTQRIAGPVGRADLMPTLEKSRPGDDDETDARVPLHTPVSPGDTLTLDVTWDDTLPTIVERVGYDGSFHFVGQWFPKLAKLEPDGSFAHFPFHHLAEFYADFGTYDVTVDVPKGYVVGATGPVVSSSDEKERHVERHVERAVHDFAFTAFDKFDRLDDTIENIKVVYLFPTGYDLAAARERESKAYASR